MKKSKEIAGSFIATGIIFFLLSTPVLAQQSQTDVLKNMEAEMKEAFGTIPLQFKVFPEHLRPAAWELMKAQQSQEAVIPAKYAELIGLAVASQIPCNHCVYFHSEMAKILGATDAEIQEAVSTAADTRFWSTVLNGSNTDFDVTKAEVDKMLMHVKNQMESAQTH